MDYGLPRSVYAPMFKETIRVNEYIIVHGRFLIRVIR